MKTLYSRYYNTPLGKMVAYANQEALLLLDFEDSKYTAKHLAEIASSYDNISSEENKILALLEKELALYFAGKLKKFTTPVHFTGTEFQKKVWRELLKIGYGNYKSYQAQADAMQCPKSVRAVANANSKNKLCLVIPCHRVIGKNMKLTGYAGGIARKEALLKLEGIVFDFK